MFRGLYSKATHGRLGDWDTSPAKRPTLQPESPALTAAGCQGCFAGLLLAATAQLLLLLLVLEWPLRSLWLRHQSLQNHHHWHQMLLLWLLVGSMHPQLQVQARWLLLLVVPCCWVVAVVGEGLHQSCQSRPSRRLLWLLRCWRRVLALVARLLDMWVQLQVPEPALVGHLPGCPAAASVHLQQLPAAVEHLVLDQGRL